MRDTQLYPVFRVYKMPNLRDLIYNAVFSNLHRKNTLYHENIKEQIRFRQKPLP
jgi:hypothetical protein